MSALSDISLWSQEQCQWLQAMGYTVYLHGDTIVAEEPPGETAAAIAPAVSEPIQRQKNPPATAPATIATPVLPAKGFSRRPPSRMPDKLMLALLRASGLDPALPETQQTMASWPLRELRGNAAAKRALWPQLRALRRK
ncbi:MAG: alanine acetyltransferase [Xanthomonadaceae bacterium]|nr:alanine acetyltransferase [Xanthomonadaceae bacterium]